MRFWTILLSFFLTPLIHAGEMLEFNRAVYVATISILDVNLRSKFIRYKYELGIISEDQKAMAAIEEVRKEFENIFGEKAKFYEKSAGLEKFLAEASNKLNIFLTRDEIELIEKLKQAFGEGYGTPFDKKESDRLRGLIIENARILYKKSSQGESNPAEIVENLLFSLVRYQGMNAQLSKYDFKVDGDLIERFSKFLASGPGVFVIFSGAMALNTAAVLGLGRPELEAFELQVRGANSLGFAAGAGLLAAATARFVQVIARGAKSALKNDRFDAVLAKKFDDNLELMQKLYEDVYKACIEDDGGTREPRKLETRGTLFLETVFPTIDAPQCGATGIAGKMLRRNFFRIE